MSAQTILFDLDGTLVDSAVTITMALNRVAAASGREAIDVDLVRGWVSLGAQELVRRALQPPETAQDAVLAEFRSVLSQLPTDSACVYPNVKATLAALKAEGWRLAVVTNKPEGLSRSLLREVGLAGFFEVVVGGDSVAHQKPHGAPLAAALERVGPGARAAAFVGDTIIDGLAARSMHVPFHLFLGGYGADDCPSELIAARFSDYRELPGILDRARGVAAPDE